MISRFCWVSDQFFWLQVIICRKIKTHSKVGYTKLFTNLHPPLPVSTDFYSPPPTSTHLPHPPSNNFYLPPPTSTHLPITFAGLHQSPFTFQSPLLTSIHHHSLWEWVFANLFSFISFSLYFFLEDSFTKIE